MSSSALKFLFSLLTLMCCATVAFAEFSKVEPGRTLRFPEDHGAHNSYPTEWWYFTGHLNSTHSTYGFELTFFRIAVQNSEDQSEWHTQSLYLAHFALTADKQRKFLFAEKIARPILDQAGAKQGNLHVWIDDWSALMTGDEIQLNARATDSELSEDFKISLRLRPQKPIVLHGKQGFSQKGPEPGQASYYMTYSRLLGDGTVQSGSGDEEVVRASAWMDHEVVSYSASSGKMGWDWFAIQLDDSRELMLYYLREPDGSISGYSAGSLINKDGSVTALRKSDFDIETLDWWTSAKTQVRYPASWRVKVPEHRIDLILKPTLNDQEIRSQKSTGMNYWEGRCLVYDPNSRQLGQAYAELVGYKSAKGD